MVNQHKRTLSKHQLGPSFSKRTRVPSSQHILLNDDAEEKQMRRKERTEQDEKNLHMLITPSTPYKQIKSKISSPSTMSNTDMSLSGFTPALKVPILANFEEWMKMATDNKINATNSWNFALIDYFHEMSFLRDGDGINFQKASCTLDGCVKIYTSRVDSAATETGKLLSGLTCSESLKNQGKDDQDDTDIDMNMEFEKQKKSKTKRSEATLVKDFSALQVKKFDLEFSVNPLFKKVLADFDEGGAKGLLLNHLFIDRQGRIIFDADDAILDEIEPIHNEDNDDIDLNGLQEKFVSIMSTLDNDEICPSFKNLKSDSDSSFSFFKVFEDLNQEGNGNFLINDTVLPDEEEFDDDIDNRTIPMITENDPDSQTHNVWGEDFVLKKLEKHSEKSDPLKVWNGNDFSVAMDETDDKVFEYFDLALKKNWAGPEYWKIQKLRKEKTSVTEPKKQKEKKAPFLIDFFSDEPIDFNILFSPGGTNIYLPKTQWISKTRNLLPDDIYFNSKQLLRFFIKPKSKIFGKYIDSHDDVEVDMNFWTNNNINNEHTKDQSVYDASFFNDNQDIDTAMDAINDDDQFMDAKEEMPLNEDEHKVNTEVFNSFTTSFKSKPDQLNYAKIAKKVDVKQLKENIWEELGFEKSNKDYTSHAVSVKTERKFTDVIKGLKNIYSERAMADISISFCFICLLHLANEKGLIIENNESLTELKIMLDTTIESA